jgi:hypothetical protein
MDRDYVRDANVCILIGSTFFFLSQDIAAACM